MELFGIIAYARRLTAALEFSMTAIRGCLATLVHILSSGASCNLVVVVEGATRRREITVIPTLQQPGKDYIIARVIHTTAERFNTHTERIPRTIADASPSQRMPPRSTISMRRGSEEPCTAPVHPIARQEINSFGGMYLGTKGCPALRKLFI